MVWVGLAITSAAAPAAASTGVCDSNPPTTTQACIDAVQTGGTVINDIFRDANNRTGPELPVFGTLYNAWPGCDLTSFAGCAGHSLAPYDCPGQYQCDPGVTNSVANAGTYLNGLDHLWWHPCRIADHTLNGACPQFGACVADGHVGDYLPWEGLVFDLGGDANKVAIFAQNDHGPQPCESLEYTVYLTNDPSSRETIADPATAGVDPNKWNRAVLATVFTKGWVEVRPPDPVGHAACGDTADYSVEEDSYSQVFTLPCGITFRYAAVIAGNDGLDFPACAFDSQEAELDAVAGLTEDGAGVCPDADRDHYQDCACAAVATCDCDDADPAIHPGAPEACDSPDLNCDGAPGGCTGDLLCYQSVCSPDCDGKLAICDAGATCTSTVLGDLCVPDTCDVGGCPAGAVCSQGQCVPSCADVVCPFRQECQDGACVDVCAGVVCPAGQACQGDGSCGPPCTCLAGNLGCPGEGQACAADGTCVGALCLGVSCDPGEHCDDATGTCVAQCAGVVCPVGDVCVEGNGCVPRCDGVVCDGGLSCDPDLGVCNDPLCRSVDCVAPLVCMTGQCIDPTLADANPGYDATGPDAGGGFNAYGAGGGCCDAGTRPGGAAALGLLVGAVLLGGRRRRRVHSL